MLHLVVDCWLVFVVVMYRSLFGVVRCLLCVACSVFVFLLDVCCVSSCVVCCLLFVGVAC